MTQERLSLFDKIKVKVRTKLSHDTLPPELKNSLANYSHYRNQLRSSTVELYRLMNGIPECRPDFKRELYAPAGSTPVDTLARGLAMLKEHAWETEFIARELEFCRRVRQTEQFQLDGHNRLGSIRRFLTTEYPKFLLLEGDLVKQSRLLIRTDIKDKARQKTDVAYMQKLAEITCLLGEKTNMLKVDHLGDLVAFMKSYADYHEQMAGEHERQITYRPALFEQPLLKTLHPAL